MSYGKLRVLKLAGSPYAMGYEHGKAYYDAIHHFTAERLRLSSDPAWTGRSLSREAVLRLAEACLDEHHRFSPALMEELRGMSDATGLGMAELLIMNGFTDFIDVVYNVGEPVAPPSIPSDNCTAFLIPNHRSANGQGYFGQTWDMHDSATPHVILIHGAPDDGPRFLTFTIAGCVGMIGMNEAGITVGINNLMAKDGQIGVMWVFVVREILRQSTLEDALRVLTSAKLAGAHNYLLMDKHGRGCNVEAMSTQHHITWLEETPLVHTNHCIIPDNKGLERERAAESLASSHARLAQGESLLTSTPITHDILFEITRDKTAICVESRPPMHVETCGAAVMQPATGDFWAVWGSPAQGVFDLFKV